MYKTTLIPVIEKLECNTNDGEEALIYDKHAVGAFKLDGILIAVT